MTGGRAASAMRHWMLALALAALVAGCAAPTETADIDEALPTEAMGGMVEGTVWLPPSQSQAREETLVDLPANQSGLRVVAQLALGAAYGPQELPLTTADVVVELRAPSGEVLSDAHLTAQAREATLEGVTAEMGPHVLAILSFGGSDGEANGDHVHYHVEAEPAEGNATA